MNLIFSYLFAAGVPVSVYAVSMGAWWHFGTLVICAVLSVYFGAKSKHNNPKTA